jgi:hypothetical protein
MWLMDASSMGALPGTPPDLYDALTQMVEDSDLCFCSAVLPELKRREAACYGWALGVRHERCHKTATWEELQDVLERAPQLSDDDAPFPSSNAEAVAQAVVIRRGARAVAMVTEDFGEVPTRMTVTAACTLFGIDCINLARFLRDIHY